MMFSQEMTTEEMAKVVSDRIFERAQQERQALDKFNQSNPGARSSLKDSGIFSQKMTTEEMAKAVSDRIFERAQQERQALDKFNQSNPNARSSLEAERTEQDREALLSVSNSVTSRP